MKDAHLDTLLRGGSLTVERPELAVTGPSCARVSSHGGHAAGEILAGKYQIVGFLGEGGMGTVWRAHSLLLDVDVAIKVLHREHGGGDASERLLREARATASLGHPAIVRVFDFNETDTGEPFLVMELLEGISLADWMDRNGRMPAAEAVRTLLPIADALVAAHAHGVIHRDVKPNNIVLVPDGVDTYLPKILDFGIAKLLTTESGRVITEEGAVLGSLEYMSPEQAEGKLEVGEQTDVWALSVVLYELVTGRRPFTGATLTAVLASLRTGRPTPTIQLGVGDEELWEIIARGLQKSRAARWPDMRTFGTALASWAIQRGITTDATATSLAHRWLARSSQPPEVPVSEPWLSSGPPSPDPSAPARLGTLETTYAAAVRLPLRRTRTLFATALATLVAVPVLLAASLYAHRGDVRARPGAFNAAPMTGAVAMATDASTATPGDAPEPAPAPSAATDSASAPAPLLTRSPARRAAVAGRAKWASTAMPLPAKPNF
jgi:serine/threonine protein kinase